MAKKPAAPVPEPNNQLELRMDEYPGKTQERAWAEHIQSPIVANAVTAWTFSKGVFGASGLNDAVEVLREKADKVKTGDLSDMEAVLVGQATALDSIFTELARRASLNMGEYINAADTYLRLALKAQSQCRATLEALAEIKAPRQVAFVRQANIAHGPQQVNNALPPTRTGETINQSNELSKDSHGLLPDARPLQAEGRIDFQVEAVGEIDRANVARG